jgi:GT2 family glycosyltransferase
VSLQRRAAGVQVRRPGVFLRNETRRSSDNKERMDRKAPRVTIVIPSLDGSRGGKLDSLLRSLRRQSYQDFEVRLMLLDPRQGRAINRAVRAARGEIVVILDDDTGLGHGRVIENLIAALDADPGIGIAGGSTVPDPSSSEFQKSACRQIPRRYFPVVDRVVDSDMAQHPCLAIRKDLFLQVGGEDEELVRGLDPLLRHRVRQAGYRVVIVPDTWVSHPLPEGLGRIFRMYFRNGRGSAYAARHFPDRIYELSDGSPGLEFAARRPIAYRAFRYPARMLASILRRRWIKLVAEAGYLTGYVTEIVSGSRARPVPPPEGRMVAYPDPLALPAEEADPPARRPAVAQAR